MELDDFRNGWNNAGETETITPKNKLMELIQHKSYGPLAVLRATLTRQFILIPLTYAILVWKLVQKPELSTDPFFGLFLGVAFIASVSFAIAYFIVQKMKPTGGNVKDTLQRQIGSLQKILLGYRITMFAGVVLLAVFLEAFQYRGTALLMQQWYDVAFGLRLAAYALLLVIVFYTARAVFHQQFGHHIQNLKELIRQFD